ncbi:hypothetical protein [Bacillus sp. JCM 19034]|uniref:YrrC family ATP-dependent DNA helicase n=1 Tax=Bacillus sp. JCM 19034 TaxID=1481928 RepID=UPI000B30E6D0
MSEEIETVERGFVKGTILHILFRNEENYYTVALIRVEKTNEDIIEKKSNRCRITTTNGTR